MTVPPGWAEDERPVVALLTHSARLSGAELLLSRIAPHLRRFKPLVVVGEAGPLEAALIERDVAVLRVPLPAFAAEHSGARAAAVTKRGVAGKVMASARYSRRLAAVLTEVGVSILYTHSAKAHLYGGLAGRIAGLPVVLHSHTIVNPASMRRPSVLAARVGAAIFPRAVIANSHAGQRSLGWLANRRPAAVIPPPLAAPVADRTRRDRHRLRFVVAGRICPGKGQDLAIQAFAKIKPRLDRESELVIVGAPMFNDDEKYAETLHPLADALGVADSVRFLGHRSDPSVVLASSDVLVHPAVEQEGFGQVIAEALAVGTPAVVPSDGGPGEIVDHGVNGLLYERGSVAAMSEAMLELARDPIGRARMGETARDAVERYDLLTLVARTEDFLWEHRDPPGDHPSEISAAK